MAFPDPMDKVRIRLQGRKEDIAKIKTELEKSFDIHWGMSAKDFTKRWAKKELPPTNKIRIYGIITSLKPPN